MTMTIAMVGAILVVTIMAGTVIVEVGVSTWIAGDDQLLIPDQ
jgi:hypothetical protein